MKQTKILTHATHVNGWFPAVYTSCMSQNFRLFHASNLSVRNFRFFLLMYPGSVTSRPTDRPCCYRQSLHRCLLLSTRYGMAAGEPYGHCLCIRPYYLSGAAKTHIHTYVHTKCGTDSMLGLYWGYRLYNPWSVQCK